MKSYFAKMSKGKLIVTGLEIARNIFEIRQEFRRYLKIEWDRAKTLDLIIQKSMLLIGTKGFFLKQKQFCKPIDNTALYLD